MSSGQSVGVIGGTGQLGWAIVRGLLKSNYVPANRLWVSNRSGRSSALEQWGEINITSCNQELVDACQIVILSVPPHLMPTLQINAKDSLVISVMAGVSTKMIEQQTGAKRVIRAMSSPAAAQKLAYSPWCANALVTDQDRETVTSIFEACGLTDEVPDEDQIDRFTVLTGPVPGFVAFYAECMVNYAVNHGINRDIANRAMGQLFLASGDALARSGMPPNEHVQEMIDYAGTTAAGLEAMRKLAIASDIAAGLDKAYEKTQSIGK